MTEWWAVNRNFPDHYDFPADTLFYTLDAGETWHPAVELFSLGPVYGASHLHFSSIDTGIVVGYGMDGGTNIHYTTNRGANWQSSTRGRMCLDNSYTSMCFNTDKLGWISGRCTGPGGLNAFFQYTEDDGISWTGTNLLVEGLEFANVIHFVDQTHGWVYGTYTDGTNNILYTTDGGNTWDTPNNLNNMDFINDIEFENASIGWAVGTDGRIMKTIDGGINWLHACSDVTNQMNDICFYKDKLGLIVGDNGLIMKYETNTETLPFTHFYPCYYELDQLGVGDRYYIDRSYTLVDVPEYLLNGTTWVKTACDDKQNPETKIQFVLDIGCTIYIGYDHRLIPPDWLTTVFTKTGDYIGVSEEEGERLELWSASFASGVVELGSNNAQTDESTMYVVIVKSNPGTTVPVELASWSAVWQNRAACLTWTTSSESNNVGFQIERRTSIKPDWIKVAFVKGHGTTTTENRYNYLDATAIADCQYEYRLKQIDRDGSYTYSSTIKVKSISMVEQFRLFQNSPNPFNPETQIIFELPIPEHVRIVIYNMKGQSIRTLINEGFSAGTHEIQWNGYDDAGNLVPTGVYYYQMQAGSFKYSRKMLMMK